MNTCEGGLSEDFKRTIKDYDRRVNCKRKPLYKLDGKCYCGNHAGLLLLRMAVEQKAIEVL